MGEIVQNVLSFGYHEFEEREGFHRYPCLDLFVDGKNLTDFFPDYAQYVTPFAIGYKDLRDELGPLEEYRGMRLPEDAYGLPFLICGECHDPHCGGVWGKLRFDGQEVIWQDFSVGDGNLSFRFDRQHYFAVLARLEEEIRRLHSSNQ